MVSNTLVALATAIAAAEAAVKGFNYGSTNTAGAALVQSDFEALMNRANDLQGTSGFNSARLYTMIQSGTTNTPIEAIPAAISTKTSLLLGMWASAGQADFDNEIAALKSAISQYPGLANMVIGLSVGSEDLYRDSVTGVENNDGVGAGPDVLTSYISQVKSALQGTALSGVSVGHVDTWDAWTNGSNAAVISAADWLGVDSYPYFETTVPNSISDAHTAFFNSYDATKAVADGKPVWITETGWPVSGPNSGSAVASTQNAETYWQDVGCQILGEINTWWYTLQDAMPTTPSPSFGIIGSDLSSAPLYDLTCKANSTSTSTTGSSTSTAASTGKSTATGGATGGAHSSGSGATATGSSAAQSSATSASGKPTLSMNGTVTASSYASASATGTGSAVWPSTTGGSSNGTATVAATSGVSATGTGPVPTSTPTQPVVNAATQAGSAMGAAILAVFALVAAF